MPISTSTKIRQYITSLNSLLYAWRFLQYAWGTCFLICSYTLREDTVETRWARRVRCVHAVDAQWQLFAHDEHAMSAPWPCSQSPSELRGSAVARRGRSSETPLSPWARRDISTLWKIYNYSLYFLVFSGNPTALWEISNHRANAVGSQESVTGA